ncbi:ribosomal protection-like ABC-F family protein [Bacillus marinisedimentorum]|uniref:ribosomal protection-like ABC-F family protein n=1 Tax=Bacillus marinisedimentorum TaxID=1821260 RepID=UPI000872AE23|nr:ABC-F type ribosomal protection protein [Bacillus marinisedimentorum]
MITCNTREISKMYGGNLVFEKLSVEVHEHDRIGLVGRNGSGKTTLFKLLSGTETPDSGQIHWKKGLTLGYLSQIPDYPDGMTAKEVLLTAFSELTNMEEKMKDLEGKMAQEKDSGKLERFISAYGDLQEQFTMLGGYEIESDVNKVAGGLQITGLLDKPFSLLSGGEKTKVGLGLILLKKPGLLLLDEPTNHLDLMAVEWLGQFLCDYTGTVVIISHDRYFLDEVVNKIVDLEDGEIHTYHTNYSGFVKEKEERLLREFQAYQEQQKKIKKMKEAIKRLKEWANRANPPNEGLHKRARNMERALERMEKLSRPALDRKKMGIQLEAADRSDKDVIEMRDAAKSFGNRELFKQANLLLQFRERAVIVGENGTGKSTLLKMILGEMEPDSGTVRLGSNVKAGYLSQHVYDREKDVTVLEAFREQVAVTEGHARHILARFLFYGHAVFRRVNQLSGGERMRLRLAQLMYQDINLLILDEPTNHLDIESREVLEEALEDFNGTLLAVSHDRYFLNKLFEKIYWIEAGSLHSFGGNYSWARAKMEEKREKEASAKERGTSKPAHAVNAGQISVNKGKTPEELESSLEEIEIRLSALNGEMAEEQNVERLHVLQLEKEKLEGMEEELFAELEKLMETNI